MTQWSFKPLFMRGPDRTEYRRLGQNVPAVKDIDGRKILHVLPETLTLLSRQAFEDVSFYFRTSHLEKLARILKDPEASDNDRFVAFTLLKNAAVAAGGVLPSCQDTGSAIIHAWKGEAVWSGGGDEEALSRGVYEAFSARNLRFSQIAPSAMFEEKNTGTNLPAQVSIHSSEGGEYRFLFIAKGGGSANKTFLFQESPALLNEQALDSFFRDKLSWLGTSACPPYHIAAVIGGVSPEMTLETVKLAAAGFYDGLPARGGGAGYAFRDAEWEDRILRMAEGMGLGAQFGGKYFSHDVRVIRLPRHAASCPVGLGVSCSADRNILGKITPEGVFLERLEAHPERFLPVPDSLGFSAAVRVDLDKPVADLLGFLSRYPVGTRLSLNGTLVVARDAAHARIKKMLEEGRPVPNYLKRHPVYYAGPAKCPEGMAAGSMGPTTSGRMDSYAELLMQNGAGLVTLGKGNRSDKVVESCRKYGGFYLGTVGGAAATLAKESILASEIADFEDLGMEAVRKIRVKDFPAFIVYDDKGNSFFGACSAGAEV